MFIKLFNCLGPGIPYNVTVVPVNLAGDGEINVKVGFSKQLGKSGPAIASIDNYFEL